MLSYFLSGNDQGPTAAIDFTTMPAASNTKARSNTNRRSTTSTDSAENNYTTQPPPPPTPAVHFYSNSTPLSSNVYRSGNTPGDTGSLTKNDNHRLPQQPQSQVYPPTLSTNMTGSTTTTQSQSSSSSSLSSLATNVQLYHQQLQMQRMMAGAGGGGQGAVSNMSTYVPPISQPQPSPNTLLYPQMLLYPPPVPSHSGGDQQQIQQSVNLYDEHSPLSPAAMIGTPSQHENLFLPRSNSFYENASKRSPNESAGEVSMGPPVSRQPSHSDMIQSTIPGASPSTGNGGVFVWPPPGTTSSHSITSIPTLPFSMMAPFLMNPMASSHDSAMSHGSTLLPNVQPFMYTSTTMPPPPPLQNEPLNGSIPSSSSSQSPQPSQPATEEESEEKRNKRLERNRESARKCRLKKKERLHTLGLQVTELHKKIEHERRTVINSMVPILMQRCRSDEIMNSTTTSTIDDDDDDYGKTRAKPDYYNPLTEIIRGSGPSSTMMRSVLEFQYSTLKDITLPHYQKLLLWFTTQKESYYTLGKEQYHLEQQRKIKQQQQKQHQQQEMSALNQKNESGTNQVTAETATTTAASGYSFSSIKSTAIKVSSKQIGEELMTGSSSSNSNDDALPKKKKSNEAVTGGSTNGGIASSAVNDGAKTWPLFCYELKLSVDQEERFVAKHKQIVFEDERQLKASTATSSPFHSLSFVREEMTVAVATTENLGKAVGNLSHMIAQRDESTYLNIMHPHQVSKYYKWLSQHRPMVKQWMLLHHNNDVPMELASSEQTPSRSSADDMDSAPSTISSVTSRCNLPNDSVSLHNISRRLSEVLQISSRQHLNKVDFTSDNRNN